MFSGNQLLGFSPVRVVFRIFELSSKREVHKEVERLGKDKGGKLRGLIKFLI